MKSSPEAELVQQFLTQLAAYQERVAKVHREPEWTVYPETAGWDLVLVRDDGCQIGIEAKMRLNPQVVSQALLGQHPSHWSNCDGPDFRAVLVPNYGKQKYMHEICKAIGIAVITVNADDESAIYNIGLPHSSFEEERYWPRWCPSKRLTLPDYVPDVQAGCAAPVQLTPWKIKAIKLMIVLERKGWVDRSDMKAIEISPTRWCDNWHGFLSRSGQGQYVRCDRTPNLKAQHPENYAQIEADRAEWGKCFDPFKENTPDWLLQDDRGASA